MASSKAHKLRKARMITSASLIISVIRRRRKMTLRSSSSLRSRVSLSFFLEPIYLNRYQVGSACYCLMDQDKRSTLWRSIVSTCRRTTRDLGTTSASTSQETVCQPPPWLSPRSSPSSSSLARSYCWLWLAYSIFLCCATFKGTSRSVIFPSAKHIYSWVI